MFSKKHLAVSLSLALMTPCVVAKDSPSQSGAYADSLELACKPFLPDYGLIPGFQPRIGEINGMNYFLDDPILEDFIRQHEDFGSFWLDGVEDDVLELAGISNFAQMNDPVEVRKYQKAWNKLKSRTIVVDGRFGEQTLRTGCAENLLGVVEPVSAALVPVAAAEKAESSDLPPAPGAIEGVSVATAVAAGVVGVAILSNLSGGSSGGSVD
ncbi:hypothetical protein OAA98_03875, partial [Porticoccaceae bacterium]|nr:hypothetical protein [Porticoccaceae bacterium]